MMQELFKQIGVTHIYSIPYHPQTNGQIERFNSTMDAKIATLCNDSKTDWDDQLPVVIFSYNTSIHAITKQVPFEMMFGRSPVLPFDHQDPNVVLSQDPEYLSKLNLFLSSSTAQARQNIIKNQQQYKKRYDINRSNPKYAINDLVLVKTLNPRHKFDIRYEAMLLTNEEYEEAKNTLHDTTLARQLTANKRKQLCKRLKDYEYSVKYLPFKPTNYTIKHINKTTEIPDLEKYILDSKNATRFFIDTESTIKPYHPNEPALIQIMILRKDQSSIVLLVEVRHLPHQESQEFESIQELFRVIFQPKSLIHIWGNRDELKSFV
ncbi:unnamed protein product, partial [Didymodactylos carnosus]